MNKEQTIRRKKAQYWKQMKKTFKINIEQLRREFCPITAVVETQIEISKEVRWILT